MIRDIISEQVRGIEPFDDLETDHQMATLSWIESGTDLFRVKKPDLPPKHLVAYFAVFDPKTKRLLLQNHLLAQAWLPPGGHVDPDENPLETVKRECREELGIEAVFFGEPKPHFVTITQVVDQDIIHTDVSLWFIVQIDEKTSLTLEKNKFAGVQWWGIADILHSPLEQFDPQMHRFCKKMLSQILREAHGQTATS